MPGGKLYRDASAHNLLLGICESLTRKPDLFENPFFASVQDATGAVQAVAVMTPPHNLVLAGWENGPAALLDLIRFLSPHQTPNGEARTGQLTL